MSKFDINPEQLDDGLTYKEGAWHSALKSLARQLIITTFSKHKKIIK